MRNLFISREIHISNLTPRKDAVAVTNNPFSNESYVLFRSGFVIGVNNNTHKVGKELYYSYGRWFSSVMLVSSYQLL